MYRLLQCKEVLYLLDFVFRLGIVAVFFVNGIFKLQNIDGVTLWMESYGFPGLFIIPAIAIELLLQFSFYLGSSGDFRI